MKKMVFYIIPILMVLMGCASSGKAVVEANGSSPGMDLDVAIREAAVQMEAKIPSKTMVALVSVASPSTAFSTQVLTRLESAIVGGGKLVVVDRANLDKVREEQGFQLSGEVDDESAKSIGKLLGAGAIVTGSLADLGDVYSLTLKTINIETATVAVSYLADLTKSARIETLLASGGGAGTGTAASRSAVQTGGTAVRVPAAPPEPEVPDTGFGIAVITRSAGDVYLDNKKVAAIKDNETFVIAVEKAGKYTLQVAFTKGGEANRTVTIMSRGVTKVDVSQITVGDTGPGGGLVFYDKGTSSGGWRYLEAAPEFTEFTSKWDDAEGRCKTLSVESGIAGWRLPTGDELNQMYLNLKTKGLGGFTDGWYWTSNRSSSSGTYYGQQNFKDGTQSDSLWSNTGNSAKVRAVQQF
jgi:hypothetical protein